MAVKKITIPKEKRVTLVSSLDYAVAIDLADGNSIIIPARGKVENLLKSKIKNIPHGIKIMEM